MNHDEATPLTPLRNDLKPVNENLRIGAQLLKAVPRLEESSARRHRVWLSLPHTGRRRLWWKPATLVVASALAGAAASAALGGAYLGARDGVDVAQGEVAEQSAHFGAPGRQKVERSNPPEPRGVEPEPIVESRQASPSSEPKRSSVKSRKAEPAPTRRVEAELMLEIMSARERGDQKRAAELLAEYRRKHPRGVLEEEALALSIESAQKKGDPQATTLAREYLRRFPAGRFRAQAERVVRGTSR